MIYLDAGATSLYKPPEVAEAMLQAVRMLANPGRGGHPAAMKAAEAVYGCREQAGKFFDCPPEQVVFTGNCTHGLNIGIRSLIQPGDRVVISGFEHNAVTRLLHRMNTEITVAGRTLFAWEDTLADFKKALDQGAKAAVFTHVSNVFGYILPIQEMAELCREHGIPFMVDAAQSAGALPVSLRQLQADFIAMPGHKGLLGPQGTGLLLCGRTPEPLLCGGTGSDSFRQEMPDFLPDRCEAGTLNVPGICGLSAGLHYLEKRGISDIHRRERQEVEKCKGFFEHLGIKGFWGDHQSGTFSFVPEMDCEEMARLLAQQGIAVRAGLHCAPLAHESAGTADTGTVRISYGANASPAQTQALVRAISKIQKRKK